MAFSWEKAVCSAAVIIDLCRILRCDEGQLAVKCGVSRSTVSRYRRLRCYKKFHGMPRVFEMCATLVLLQFLQREYPGVYWDARRTLVELVAEADRQMQAKSVKLAALRELSVRSRMTA